jgi:hypothetical protein
VAVDVEQLVVGFLRGQDDITTLVADRVFTDLPNSENRKYPLLLVQRSGGGFTYKRWLDAAELTVGCYGGTHKLAQQIASAVISTMDATLVGQQPEGVVTKVSVGSTVYEPEPDSVDLSGHARPRFTVTLTVITHPTQTTATTGGSRS